MRNIFFPHYLSGEPKFLLPHKKFFLFRIAKFYGYPIKFLLPYDVNVDCYVL